MKTFFVFILIVSLGLIVGGLFVSGWVSLIGLILLILAFSHRGTTRCPACKQYWALKRVGEQYIRSSDGFYKKDSDGKRRKYQKNYFEVYWECVLCNHKYSKEVEREEHLGD